MGLNAKTKLKGPLPSTYVMDTIIKTRYIA